MDETVPVERSTSERCPVWYSVTSAADPPSCRTTPKGGDVPLLTVAIVPLARSIASSCPVPGSVTYAVAPVPFSDRSNGKPIPEAIGLRSEEHTSELQSRQYI